MEHILKYLPLDALYPLIAAGLLRLGTYLKDKDDDGTGTDDAAGNICVAMAPAIAALENNTDNAKRKALTVLRDTIDGYLRGNSPSKAKA